MAAVPLKNREEMSKTKFYQASQDDKFSRGGKEGENDAAFFCVTRKMSLEFYLTKEKWTKMEEGLNADKVEIWVLIDPGA